MFGHMNITIWETSTSTVTNKAVNAMTFLFLWNKDVCTTVTCRQLHPIVPVWLYNVTINCIWQWHIDVRLIIAEAIRHNKAWIRHITWLIRWKEWHLTPKYPQLPKSVYVQKGVKQSGLWSSLGSYGCNSFYLAASVFSLVVEMGIMTFWLFKLIFILEIKANHTKQ